MDDTARIASKGCRPTTLFVCSTCRRDGEAVEPKETRSGARLMQRLKNEASSDAGLLEIVAVACLSNCTRSCAVAVAAPGKWTFVIGNIDPDVQSADVLLFARQHHAQDDGIPVWRERPEYIRKNTVARIPPIPSAQGG